MVLATIAQQRGIDRTIMAPLAGTLRKQLEK
jgi:hypothetical protein